MRTKLKLLPILLITVGISACGKLPVAPTDPIYQPIIEQVLCDNQGVCEKKSLCREFTWQNGKYEVNAEYELKKCHGIIGFNSRGYANLMDYIRRLKDWVRDHCRLKGKRDSTDNR